MLPEAKMATPLPLLKVAIIGAIIFADTFGSLVIFPFLPFMVKDFFPETPTDQLGTECMRCRVSSVCVCDRARPLALCSARHACLFPECLMKAGTAANTQGSMSASSGLHSTLAASPAVSWCVFA